MALLTRFIRLPDRANTHVFTFVVTRSVTRDLHRDVTSKEFSYGYHRWAITFSRAGKVLGVYLVWRNPSEVSNYGICHINTQTVYIINTPTNLMTVDTTEKQLTLYYKEKM